MTETHLEEKPLNWFAFGHSNKNQLKLLTAFGLVLFVTPFLSPNQLITGTIINALLIKAAIDIKSKKVFALSIVPSIAAFSAGIIFGNLTHQVLLMLPFIWAGNAMLLFLMRKLFVAEKKEFFLSNLLAGTLKTTTLFCAAITLFFLGLAPEIVLIAFGIMQFATVMLGGAGVIAYKKIRDIKFL